MEEFSDLESDLLGFQNTRIDGFTSFLNFTIVDIYHKLLGKHIHVSTTIPPLLAERDKEGCSSTVIPPVGAAALPR